MARSLHLARRLLNRERRQLVADQLRETPGWATGGSRRSGHGPQLGLSRCRNLPAGRPTYRREATPITLREANAFVKEHHRHSCPVTGCRFAVGCKLDGKLVGVGIAGRPVARRLDDGRTLEILRVATDGTPNACSFLYARVARIARLLGYKRILTYTLEAESGASLRAVGARITGEVRPQEWSVPSRSRKSQAVYKEAKVRWEL